MAGGGAEDEQVGRAGSAQRALHPRRREAQLMDASALACGPQLQHCMQHSGGGGGSGGNGWRGLAEGERERERGGRTSNAVVLL